MKVPLSWLKEYVDITMSPEALAHTMTMAGLEVEAIEYVGADWGDKIITAQIIHLEKVPGSDHLSYTRVITGKEELGVVCGASNIRQGDKVPLAKVGAKVGDLTIGEKVTLGWPFWSLLACASRSSLPLTAETRDTKHQVCSGPLAHCPGRRIESAGMTPPLSCRAACSLG